MLLKSPVTPVETMTPPHEKRTEVRPSRQDHRRISDQSQKDTITEKIFGPLKSNVQLHVFTHVTHDSLKPEK